MNYNLELKSLIDEIKKKNYKTILIQLPDGLKPKAGEIASEIESNTSASVIIWAGSCFGACDIPPVEKLKFDLVVQFGHSKWV